MTSPSLTFIKTFADLERLQIAAYLVRQPANAVAIAQALGFQPVRVARHLEKLAASGLLREDTSQSGAYHFERSEFELKARQALQEAGSIPASEAEKPQDEAAKILAAFSNPDGSLKALPSQDKKLRVLLSAVAAKLDPERTYTEKELNISLVHFYRDVPALRRYLVDYGFLQREKNGAHYWLNKEKGDRIATPES